jgi:hypothetical protein
MEARTHVISPFFRPVRRTFAGLACAVLLTGIAGCTSDTDQPAPEPPPRAATGTAPTIDAKPVPMELTVSRVYGKLKKPRLVTLERKVARTVGAYFNDAHLGGTYPRSDFRASFATFSDGAAQQARGDLDLLTNARLGTSTVAVVPRKKKVRIAVFSPRKVAAGVTARIRLVYLAERDEAADQLVTVSGRLLLTRLESGRWQIFGYDVARTTRPAEKGASR